MVIEKTYKTSDKKSNNPQYTPMPKSRDRGFGAMLELEVRKLNPSYLQKGGN